MVLKPLEFTECLADSPWFRENLREHEESLESATKKIKGIEQHCRKLISCTIKISQAQKSFAIALNEFKIETVGTTQTDDERIIGNSLKNFSQLILQIEEERSKIIEEAERRFFEPLQKLADSVNKVVRDEKHKYNKESNRFYTGLEKHLHLSTVRKNDFREADAQLGHQQKNFWQASLQYVAEIQAIQERIKFEFVETLSSFLYEWLSFYHVSYVIHKDFCDFYDGINTKVQKAKENFLTTQAEAKELKDKMLISYMKNAVFSSSSIQSSSDVRPTNCNIKQGYIYLQEKRILPKTISRDVLPRNWTKYYCVYSKESRIFTMIPVNSTKTNMKGTLEQSVSFKLKSCVRRASDSIDKRFCFDVIPDSERSEVMTFQALSEEDRRQWLDAMDGREPVYSPGTGPPFVRSFNTMLDENGFDFIRQCIKAIEDQGIREQGIYRNCGVTSKVQRLMQLALDKKKSSAEKLNLTDDTEWETKTISSAIKTFLRNLPEPLMTFDLHHHFINAAKMDDVVQRVNHIHYYVYKLPEVHRHMLELIIKHLKKVADLSYENRMTVGNLGVCFGPTLLRPKEETMAAIMDIKFCNVIVEVLITNSVQIFDSQPPQQIGLPCPPKPIHNLVAVMPPANEFASVSLTSLKNTNSASNITNNLNDQKSISNECFYNAETSNRIIKNSDEKETLPSINLSSANLTKLCSSNSAAAGNNQLVSVATVRQRQPAPLPPTLPRYSSGIINNTKNSVSSLVLPENFFDSPTRLEHPPIVFDSPSSSSFQTFSSKTLATLSLAVSRYHRSSGYSSTSNVSHNENTKLAFATAPLHMAYALKSDKLISFPHKIATSATNLLTDTYSNQKSTFCHSNIGLRKGSLSPKAKQRSLTPLTIRRRSFSSRINPTDISPIKNNANTSSVSSNFCSPYPSTVFNNNYTNNIITNTNSGNASPVNHSLEFSNSTDSTLVSIALPQSTLYQPHQNSFLTSKSLSGNQINNSSAFTKTKMSASYAPPYNPFTYDNSHSNISQEMPLQQLNLSTTPSVLAPNSMIDIKSSLNQPQSESTSDINNGGGLTYGTRIPQVYSNFINPNVQFQPSRRVRTLYSCSAGHETELSFEPGQIITNVYESKEEGWLVGTLNGKTGLIPANYVEHILGP